MTPSIKAKWSFLSHVKLGAQFYLVEIYLADYISQSTIKQFEGILNDRKNTRDQVRIEEEYYHKAVEIENNNLLSSNYESYAYHRKSFNSNTSNKNTNDRDFDPTLEEAFNTVKSINLNSEVTLNNTLVGQEIDMNKADSNTIKAEIKENINSNQTAKLEFLLQGGSYDQLQKEEEKRLREKEKEKLKEFIYNDEEFPELNSEFFDDEEKKISSGCKKKGFGVGGRKKKKKFVELNI